MLVPEITLTHQIVGRLRARFGDSLAVLHSGLRPAERVERVASACAAERRRSRSARARRCSPRSRDLGLDRASTRSTTPPTSTRRASATTRASSPRARARAAGCPLVLGSATPALETRYAAERGELRRLVLSHRIGGRPLPAVELVDLAKERAALPRGRKLILSRSLARALADVLADGGQTLLFLNRRGFSTQITCFACGRVERCPDCDIALVFHADGGPPALPLLRSPGSAAAALRGLRLRASARCSASAPSASKRRCARASPKRASRASTATRRAAAAPPRRCCAPSGSGASTWWSGTQMLAKGHDFPGVTLVGVVHADLGLHFPDFRAAERTFQLLTQVAGRAGRGGEPGRVVVQTWLPDHYALRRVPDHDYESFYREELAQRAALGYPPCGSLARALVSARGLEAARGGGRDPGRERRAPRPAASPGRRRRAPAARGARPGAGAARAAARALPHASSCVQGRDARGACSAARARGRARGGGAAARACARMRRRRSLQHALSAGERLATFRPARSMAVAPEVLQFPDPRLKRVAEPSRRSPTRSGRSRGDMVETMYDEPGIGLAAPQVGESDAPDRPRHRLDGRGGRRRAAPARAREPGDRRARGHDRSGTRAASRCRTSPPRSSARRACSCARSDLDGSEVESRSRGAPRGLLPARDRPPRRHALHRPHQPLEARACTCSKRKKAAAPRAGGAGRGLKRRRTATPATRFGSSSSARRSSPCRASSELLAGRHPVVGVVSQPDRPRGRGRMPSPSPVAARALAAGLPLLRPERVGDERHRWRRSARSRRTSASSSPSASSCRARCASCRGSATS